MKLLNLICMWDFGIELKLKEIKTLGILELNEHILHVGWMWILVAMGWTLLGWIACSEILCTFRYLEYDFIYSSVQFRWSVMSDSLRPHGLQHTRPPCPSPTPRAFLNSCPSSWWCHPTILFSVIPLSSRLQSFPPVSFPMSQFFTSCGQSIGVSASASVFPMNIQDWFPFGSGWISLQSKRLSRVFSNTTVQKHQFFYAQLSLWSNSHILTWLLEKP